MGQNIPFRSAAGLSCLMDGNRAVGKRSPTPVLSEFAMLGLRSTTVWKCFIAFLRHFYFMQSNSSTYAYTPTPRFAKEIYLN